MRENERERERMRERGRENFASVSYDFFAWVHGDGLHVLCSLLRVLFTYGTKLFYLVRQRLLLSLELALRSHCIVVLLYYNNDYDIKRFYSTIVTST